MTEAMTFPDSVEEFMESYKVVDTEHIYTNGIEFVPIFRMKQWFEHLPSARPDYKTDHGYIWLCPRCGTEIHSDYDRCIRRGYERRTK